MPEEKLLILAKAGDHDAVTALVKLVNEDLISQERAKFWGNADISYQDIEDAVQCAWETFISNPLQVQARSIDSFRAWLSQVATRRIINMTRTSYFKTRDLLPKSNGEDGEDHDSKEYALLRRSGLDNEIEEEVVGHVFIERATPLLQAAIAGLSPTNKCIVEDYYFKNLDIKEIAAKYGLSTDATKKRKQRALEALYKILKEDIG